MPLDNFQRKILRTILPNRSPQSHFAGGSVLQRHGFRLSDHQDIFHSEDADLVAIARMDAAALVAEGLSVELRHPYAGFVEASVFGEAAGTTRLQWVAAGTWNFFQPVPDAEFGWRLHMADLAVNKALAAGGRKEVRDYADLALIHRHVMPLWHVLWAAPGKDESWSPASLLEKVARTNGFRQADLEGGVVSIIPLNAAEIGGIVRDALEEAREAHELLPATLAGRMFVDERGEPVNDLKRITSGHGVANIDAARGGAWPSGLDIDHAMIERVIAAYGGGAATPPSPGSD